MTFELSRFQFWLDSVMGQYTDVDRFAGAQCWDLAAAFSRFFGLPVINTTGGSGKWAGYAGTMYRDYPQTADIEAAYERIPASEPGQAGDLAVWGDSFWYYPATHVAVVISDEGPTHLRCASQNSSPSRWDNPYPGQSSGPTMDQWLPKQGLLGYLRARKGLVLQGEIIQSEEFDMAAKDEVIAYIFQIFFGKYSLGGRDDNPGLAYVIVENQKRIDRLTALVAALPSTIWWNVTVERGGKKIPAIQEMANIRNEQLGQSDVLVQIAEQTTAEAFAAAIPAAEAQAFIDALVNRLQAPAPEEIAAAKENTQ